MTITLIIYISIVELKITTTTNVNGRRFMMQTVETTTYTGDAFVEDTN